MEEGRCKMTMENMIQTKCNQKIMVTPLVLTRNSISILPHLFHHLRTTSMPLYSILYMPSNPNIAYPCSVYAVRCDFYPFWTPSLYSLSLLDISTLQVVIPTLGDHNIYGKTLNYARQQQGIAGSLCSMSR